MDDRDETGQFNQQYSDEAFLRAVESVSVASTQNVAEAVGCSYDLAYRRLNSLDEDGRVGHERVGRSFVWVPSESRDE